MLAKGHPGLRARLRGNAVFAVAGPSLSGSGLHSGPGGSAGQRPRRQKRLLFGNQENLQVQYIQPPKSGSFASVIMPGGPSISATLPSLSHQYRLSASLAIRGL